MSNQNDLHFEEIMANRGFHHLYQPLYVLSSWKLLGYEALLRSPFFQDPESLFHLSMEKNRLYELETGSVLKAVSSFTLEPTNKLFLNIYPSTAIHPSFHLLLDHLPYPHHNIVFEINEGELIPDQEVLRSAVILLKEKGYTIAIDDFGKGETSLSTALYLEPSFVKLDRYFATDLATSVNKIEVIRTLIDIFQKKKINIVLEGIERPIDLAMAKALGVDIGQGYLLGMPKPISEIHVTRS